MFRKMTSIITAIVLLLSISSPAIAAQNDAPQITVTEARTIEEILNSHHQKINALNAEYATNSNVRTQVTKDSIIGETISELRTAGYEAYHVTNANYASLENELKSDFSSMGIEPEGSYIIVISGDESSSTDDSTPAFHGHNSSAAVASTQSYFNYTYNGVSYRMRYVTVTPDDNSRLGQVNDVELLASLTESQRANALNWSLTLLSFVPNLSTTTTILSLISSVLPNASSTVPASLDYTATSVWKTKYTQVYHTGDQEWRMSACVESLTSQYWIDYYYYVPSEEKYDRDTVSGELPTLYSTYYTNSEYMKQVAAYAFLSNAQLLDIIEEAVYKYNGTVVLTHQRWSEYTGYEPA